ncbi:TIGR02569 family protein [Herbihabitans rhizosphaerae]|uniref:TIGR02569 family protein n=1 Tax=Herbihabitans rhizosphaerae TaxID=1872711 RepID=UPI00102B18CB|nr:TIGR02569 family protein [Herbihabitans rhizosphaerae]
MGSSAVQPPQHVLAAFGAKDGVPEPVGTGPVWRAGDTAFRPATNPAQASWVAQTLGELEVTDLRVGRPLRSSDGRYVVGGWVAFKFVEGRHEPRYDDMVAASLRLHQATADLDRPRFLGNGADVFTIADRVAWDAEEAPMDPKLGGRLFDVFSGSCRPVHQPLQVVHGDLFGNMLFDGDEAPGITDFTPFFRPAEWAAAVIVVDAIAWGGADDGLVSRWSHLSEWPQMVLRALLFRLAVHAMHPHSNEQSLLGLEHAANRISALV